MTKADKYAWVSGFSLTLAVIMAALGAALSPWFLIATGLCVGATKQFAKLEVAAYHGERQLPSPDHRAAYLPDAEREIDAMGLNGPALREAERPTTDGDRLKANALAPVPPKPTGYVMAGRVFPAPEDPGWNCKHYPLLVLGEVQVWDGFHPTVNVSGVLVVAEEDAKGYAKAIRCAQKARALASLPLAPSEKERA